VYGKYRVLFALSSFRVEMKDKIQSLKNFQNLYKFRKLNQVMKSKCQLSVQKIEKLNMHRETKIDFTPYCLFLC
jgi:hypothetical protein